MSKFNDLFNTIISEMNINLVSEAECKPDTMLNQAALNAKKIPQERKPKVVVKRDGNTTGITYNVDTDASAAMMTANIKANGGDATAKPGSGITKESEITDLANIPETDVEPVEPIEHVNQETEFVAPEFDKAKYEQFLEEGKKLGIDEVTKFLQDHSDEVSQDFMFNEAPEDEYFIEYALVRYNQED